MKIADLQRKADQRAAKAESDAKAKIGEAEKQLELLKSELATAKTKLEEAGKAQSTSEVTAKQLETALAKARQAFKSEARLKLAMANKDLTEVSGKAAKAPAKVRPAVTKALQEVTAKQRAVAKDLSEFDGATLETLDSVRSKFEKDLNAMLMAVRAARAKVP